MIYIKNARAVDGSTGMDELADIAIVNEFIAGVGKDLDIEEIKARYEQRNLRIVRLTDEQLYNETKNKRIV